VEAITVSHIGRDDSAVSHFIKKQISSLLLFGSIFLIGSTFAFVVRGWEGPSQIPPIGAGPLFADNGKIGIGTIPTLKFNIRDVVLPLGSDRFMNFGSFASYTGFSFGSNMNFGSPWGGFWSTFTANPFIKFVLGNTGSPGDISFITDIPPNETSKIYVTDSGNVGIGTEIPRAPLEIAGGIVIETTPQVGVWNSRIPRGNQTLNYSQSSGRNLAMTTGIDGFPVLVYFQGSAGGIFRFLKCYDFNCSLNSTNVIDASGEPGRGDVISIGPDGNPIIAYTANDTGIIRVKVAKCSDPACANCE